MTQLVSRSVEPLYIVIIRGTGAETLLRAWSQQHRAQVQIQDNRMKLYELKDLTTFQMTWRGDWNSVQIWDCWNRRHIDLG